MENNYARVFFYDDFFVWISYSCTGLRDEIWSLLEIFWHF